MRALASSDKARNTLVRNPCRSVRHDSPGSVDRRELMLCVATIGMQRACRANEKNFSSPDGSFSPVVAKAWYSSHTKHTERHGCVDAAVIFGMRLRTAR